MDLSEQIISLKGVCGIFSDMSESSKNGFHEYSAEELIVVSNILASVIDDLEEKMESKNEKN